MNEVPTTQALCRQCSVPLTVEQGAQLVNCEFCGTANALDKSHSVFHYVVRETLRPHEAEAMLKRWMGGNDTVKNLDQKAQIKSSQFELFPMWLVRTKHKGQEQVFMEPAAALSVSELKHLQVPASDLEPFTQIANDVHVVQATVPYNTMVKWLQEEHQLNGDEIKESAIVHIPIYIFKYTFDKREYTAVVDAAIGKVFSNIFPNKWETPYQVLGGITMIAYFLASLVPAIGYFASSSIGLELGIIIYLILSVAIAIPVFLIAMYISAKV